MPNYQEDWKEYRRVRNTFIAVILSCIPVCVLVAFASVKLFHTLTPAFVTAFLWMALLLFSGERLNVWRCPRCGDTFSGTWLYNIGFFARRCVHCGLRKYEK